MGRELLSYPLPLGGSPGHVVRFKGDPARFLCLLDPAGREVFIGGGHWISPPLLLRWLWLVMRWHPSVVQCLLMGFLFRLSCLPPLRGSPGPTLSFKEGPAEFLCMLFPGWELVFEGDPRWLVFPPPRQLLFFLIL